MIIKIAGKKPNYAVYRYDNAAPTKSRNSLIRLIEYYSDECDKKKRNEKNEEKKRKYTKIYKNNNKAPIIKQRCPDTLIETKENRSVSSMRCRI